MMLSWLHTTWDFKVPPGIISQPRTQALFTVKFIIQCHIECSVEKARKGFWGGRGKGSAWQKMNKTWRMTHMQIKIY